MSPTNAPATDREHGRVRLDRPVLVSNLVSGAFWLLPFLLFWPMFLVGVGYVVAASVFLAAVYARELLTRRQEALAWISSWLCAVALWTATAISVAFPNSVSQYLVGFCVAVVIATLWYLAWQFLALPVRHFMAWRSGRSFLPV